MNELAFVETREPDWKRLVFLCEKADVSPRNLTEAELVDLVDLYRRCSADLALVRTKSANVELIAFLNDHVRRAYSTLYRAPRKPLFRAIGDAVKLAARTVRKLQYFVLASFLTFIASIAFAYIGCATNPNLESVLVPDDYKPVFSSWKSGTFEERTASDSGMMSIFYMSHNPLTAIVQGATAAGTFGIGSAISIFNNGAVLGALMYEMNTVGKEPFLLASILPHGVTELSGFILAGAAGYSLGWALILPGRRRRRDALMEAGKDAIVVLSAAVVMMFMAAPVEGFFSFNPRIPLYAKGIFAVFAAAAWTLFWLGYGREPDDMVATAQS